MARTFRLYDRICQIYENDESYLNIPINRFNGACVGILNGSLTTAQVKAFFDLTGQEEADFDDLIGRITAKSNTGNTNPRDRAVEWIRTILVFYEDGGIPTFQTPEEVWSHLMAI